MAKFEKKTTEVVTEGEVIIKMKKPLMAQPQYFSVYVDDEGLIHQYKDRNGKKSKITISSPVTKLYRSNPMHKPMIEFIMGMMASPAGKLKSQALEVIDKVVDAKSKNETRALITRASADVQKYLDEGKEEELGFMLSIYTRLNVKDYTKMDKEVLKAEIYTMLDAQPEKVLEILNNPDKEYYLTFFKGIAKGIFKLGENAMYKFNAAPMGTTNDEAVVFLKTNGDVYAALKPEINK